MVIKVRVPMLNLVWTSIFIVVFFGANHYKKLSYCWETVRRDSMPRIAEMDVKMTT